MANPQKENGYTPIANEILEELVKLPLNGTQLRIVCVVWRFTYGFSRKEHELSETFILRALGLNKGQLRQVKRELKALIDSKILLVVKEPTFNRTRVIAFNKNYDDWCLNKHQVTKKTPHDFLDTQPGDFLDTRPGDFLDTQDKQKTNIKTNTYTDDFEKFYSEYPRPEDKRRSFNNWKTQLKHYSANQLMSACENYKAAKAGTEKQYLKSSANFLGRERPFEDYLTTDSQHDGNNETSRPYSTIIKAPAGWRD
jgi:phage replication O-like protein O